MEQIVVRIGNSAGVVIPKPLREQVGIKAGDKIILEVDPTGNGILLSKKGNSKKVSSITPEFFKWLMDFEKRHADVLKELAER